MYLYGGWDDDDRGQRGRNTILQSIGAEEALALLCYNSLTQQDLYSFLILSLPGWPFLTLLSIRNLVGTPAIIGE